MPSPYSPRQRLLLGVLPPLAAGLIRLLGTTLRYHDLDNSGPVHADEHPGASIFAFPHRSLLACAHRFRGLGIHILISRSFDGELIARTVEWLGFVPVRGSSSRGGAGGLRGLARAYEGGGICAITVDGPRGPALVVKPGASQLAALSGAREIGVFYALPRRAWQLRSWDRFLIPKPFSRVDFMWVAATEPTEVASVQAALDAAAEMVGGQLPPASS